jgi:hypothetical protein
MAHESFFIRFGGAEDAELYPDVVGLEVELSDGLPGFFRIVLQMGFLQDEGTWMHLDDERFRVWSEVSIGIGFTDAGAEEVLSGYVTRVTPRFHPSRGQSVLELQGMDAAVKMDREEKLKAWAGMKDSDVATQVLQTYGFTPEVEATETVHEEALSTIIQRETDLQFLNRLARRNGFACWMEGTTAHFGPLPADEEPQPVLAYNFGDETNLRSFTATVDALAPALVSMHQLDPVTREVLSAEVTEPEREALGSLDPAAMLGAGIDPGKVFVAKAPATGLPEMTALATGVFHERAWLVSAEGEVDSAAYGAVLKPRGVVAIKGVGETFSGVYYVSFVRHTLSHGGYSQFFRARRDALLPTGDEDFGGGGGLLGGLL